MAEASDRLEGLHLGVLDEAFRAGATQAVDQVHNSTRTTDPRAQADLRLALDLGDRFTTTGQALSDLSRPRGAHFAPSRPYASSTRDRLRVGPRLLCAACVNEVRP